MAKTDLGLEENIEALLAYVLPFSGIAFLLIEKKNQFVRFHAMQSLVFFILWFVLWVISFVLAVIPFFGWIFRFIYSYLLYLLGLILWILLMVKAYQGEKYKVPFVGD
ncbi:DUF4870 domain-containing protein, partial [Candidatus Woesearchaeota archaeon]